MSKKNQLLVAVAALALAGATSAGATQGSQPIAVSAGAPVATLVAGEIRLASEVIPSDFGASRVDNGEQHIAKTALFGSIFKKLRSTAKKVARAVKKTVTTTKCNLVPSACKPKRIVGF